MRQCDNLYAYMHKDISPVSPCTLGPVSQIWSLDPTSTQKNPTPRRESTNASTREIATLVSDHGGCVHKYILLPLIELN
jgi:hypothetical protein